MKPGNKKIENKKKKFSEEDLGAQNKALKKIITALEEKSKNTNPGSDKKKYS